MCLFFLEVLHTSYLKLRRMLDNHRLNYRVSQSTQLFPIESFSLTKVKTASLRLVLIKANCLIHDDQVNLQLCKSKVSKLLIKRLSRRSSPNGLELLKVLFCF